MGKVFLVGAGPGDPELLTRKAARVLAQANVVLHDSLVSAEVLQLASPNTEMVDVGKRAGLKLLTQDEINSLLVDYATRHEVVVRLKGGDPMLFGRASEEIEALRRANVAFEVVPGITAALGAAASAGFSLTDRRVASQVLFTTFSRGSNAKKLGWREITSDTTLAIYMPGVDYAEVAARLVDAGLDAETPCAVISHATRSEQQIHWTTIAALFYDEKLPAPAVMIVGKVATQAVQQIAGEDSARRFGRVAYEDFPLQTWIEN
ncbi:MAG TPA: uroporphyrinogen-III C-methyltransferase [Candidatus Acidoferrum sp.]|nr:uroporphyrinogen-III C-methyltransferase [Candidatus Acidoferrum sp.]